MEKTKIGLVVSVILIVVLATANIWLFTVQQNQINTLQNEVNDLRSYVSTHSHTDSEYDALTKQKTQLETWLAENMTYINSLDSQITDLQDQILVLNDQIANLQDQISYLNVSDAFRMSYENILNAYSFNRTSSPAPFYEQITNIFLVDNSSNFLGSLAGDLRVSRISEPHIQTSLIFSFLGRRDSRFNIDNVTVSVRFQGPITKHDYMPPPPGVIDKLWIKTLSNGECVTFFEQTNGASNDSIEYYFYFELNSYWGDTTYLSPVVLRGSDGKVWKSEETFDLGILGVGFMPLSEMEGKTETETFTVVVHEVAS